jgi:bifunctional DNA-binding transcriptional regulator/antitoxin component of YhaV-PrlF toxin-antitoxin module
MGITTVPLVKVKGKYQVTLPVSVRLKMGVLVGDLLEAKVEKDKITLTPKRVVDREIAMALDDIRKGRVHGPFGSVDKMLRSLHTARKKRRKIS